MFLLRKKRLLAYLKIPKTPSGIFQSVELRIALVSK